MKNGVPTLCVPDPKAHSCVKPYHDRNDVNHGGPHGAGASARDVAGGKMTGFMAAAESGKPCTGMDVDPNCSGGSAPDVMGYHDGREIPNYWAYAHDFVLQDRMFEPNSSWSLPAHLFLVSEWSALCSRPNDPSSCSSNIEAPQLPTDIGPPHAAPDHPWTDLTYLFD